MKCILLAAGRGTRLRPLTDRLPKCLLSVGTRPILQWTLESLFALGIEQVCIVTGYRAPQIRRFVAATFPRRRIVFLHNRAYATTNNAYSLFLARKFVTGSLRTSRQQIPFSTAGRGSPMLLLDSDIVFHPGLLRHLINQPFADRLAVRVRGHHDSEEMRVQVDTKRMIVRIGKDVPTDHAYGESVGIEIFSPPSTAMLFTCLERRIRRGRRRQEFYEAAFQEMIDGGLRVRAVDVGRYHAMEIDTRDDYARACATIGPILDHG